MSNEAKQTLQRRTTEKGKGKEQKGNPWKEQKGNPWKKGKEKIWKKNELAQLGSEFPN